MPLSPEGFDAVAFDLDGTLIDSAPDLAAATNRMLIAMHGEPLPFARIRAFIGDGVDQLVTRSLSESFGERGCEAALRSEALSLFRGFYAEDLFVDSRVYAGVAPALRSLERGGIARCCVTNKDSTFALPLLEAAGLSGLLGMSFCGDRVEERKPAAALLLKACAWLGVSPQRMLYVGDSAKDVAAARAAGCSSAVVTYGYGAADAMRAGPDVIVASLTELRGLGSGRGVA
jgi:phosphoglycolate phosphatase